MNRNKSRPIQFNDCLEDLLNGWSHLLIANDSTKPFIFPAVWFSDMHNYFTFSLYLDEYNQSQLDLVTFSRNQLEDGTTVNNQVRLLNKVAIWKDPETFRANFSLNDSFAIRVANEMVKNNIFECIVWGNSKIYTLSTKYCQRLVKTGLYL